jgi:hypothetical protein
MRNTFLQAAQDKAFDACAKAALRGDKATQATYAMIDWLEILADGTEEQREEAERYLRRRRRLCRLFKEVGLC